MKKRNGIIFAIIISIVIIGVGGVLYINNLAIKKENRQIELVSSGKDMFSISTFGIEGKPEVSILIDIDEKSYKDLFTKKELEYGISIKQIDKLKKQLKNISINVAILDKDNKVVSEQSVGNIDDYNGILNLKITEGQNITAYLTADKKLNKSQFFIKEVKDLSKLKSISFKPDFYVPTLESFNVEDAKKNTFLWENKTSTIFCKRLDPNLDYIQTTGYNNLSYILISVNQLESSFETRYWSSSNLILDSRKKIVNTFSTDISKDINLFASSEGKSYYNIDEVNNDFVSTANNIGFTCDIY